MRHNRIYQAGTFFLSAFLYVTAAMTPITALAAPADLNEAAAQQEERLTLPIQSNEIENWPEGPAVGAEGAIVLEANTGVVLYAKNIHEKLYPASTTKLLTCLIAARECSMDEIHRQFETNFFGTVRMIRKVLPSMRAVRNGAIVCFSSIAAAGLLSQSISSSGSSS